MGKHGSMTVIGDHGINDNDDVFPACRNTKDFHHRIIIVLIAAQDGRLQPFHTYMERVDKAEATIREGAAGSAVHG